MRQIAIASTGRTDAQNTNREVDLNLFPTELFTQLTVSKDPDRRHARRRRRRHRQHAQRAAVRPAPASI